MSTEIAEKYLAILLTLTLCTTRLSMAVGHIFYGLATALILYLFYKNKKSLSLDRNCKGIIKAYAVLLICFLPSVFFSFNIGSSLKTYVDAWVYRFVMFVGIAYFIHSRKILSNMLAAFMAVFGIDCLVAMGQVFIKHAYRGWGFGGSTQTMAGILVMMFPLAIVVMMDERFEDRLRKVATWSVITSLIGFAFNKGRGSWLVTALMAPLASVKYILASKKRIVACVLIVCAIGSVFAFHPAYNKRIKSISNITTDRSNGDRVVVWKTAPKIIDLNPYTGIGAGQFKKVYNEQFRTKEDTQGLIHCHNNFIQVMVEYGGIGLFGLLAFLFLSLKQCVQNYLKKANPYDMLVFTSITGLILLFGQIEYCLDNSANMRILWFLVAILLKLRLTDPELRESEEGVQG